MTYDLNIINYFHRQNHPKNEDDDDDDDGKNDVKVHHRHRHGAAK